MERGEQKLRGKVSDEKGKGMGNWLETKKQLTVTASDFVTQFSACPALHVKQIFIAVFYLHFWFSDHDFFLARFLTECNFFLFFSKKFTLSFILMPPLGMKHFLLFSISFCRCRKWNIFAYKKHFDFMLWQCFHAVYVADSLAAFPVGIPVLFFYITYFISLYSFPARRNITR